MRYTIHDDVIIYSVNVKQHIADPEKVLGKFGVASVRPKRGEYHFFMQEVKIFGHVVGKGGIKPNPDKTRATWITLFLRISKNFSSFLDHQITVMVLYKITQPAPQ